MKHLVLALTLDILLCSAGPAMAMGDHPKHHANPGKHCVPELDAAGGLMAITLLGGVLYLMSERRRTSIAINQLRNRRHPLFRKYGFDLSP